MRLQKMIANDPPPLKNWSLPTHDTVGETHKNPKGKNYLVFSESQISRREKAI
jgi:hypothetical protein